MDLLFDRARTMARRVTFLLWAKIELTEEEHDLINTYRMKQAVLVSVPQPGLLPRSVLVGFGAFAVAAIIVIFGILPETNGMISWWAYPLAALGCGGVAGYLFYNENRETIRVADLLHGRHFNCDSVIELARKEAFLESITEYFRQVLESAKHWGDAQRVQIEPLPPEEAKRRILSGPMILSGPLI